MLKAKLIAFVVETLADKDKRRHLIEFLLAIFTILAIFAFLCVGFFAVKQTIFGGTEDDNFAVAIDEIKTEENIENTLDPSNIRALYFFKYKNLDYKKDDIKKLIKKYFLVKLPVPETESIEISQPDGTELSTALTAESTSETKPEKPAPIYRFVEFSEFISIIQKPPFKLSKDEIEEIRNFKISMENAVKVDFSDINFENEEAGDLQKTVVKIAICAEEYGITLKPQMCQAYVADVYEKALGVRGHAESAVMAGRVWSVSEDWKTIQVGAAVYGNSNCIYGHVGIYIGGGKVAHNINGKVIIQPLDSFINQYNCKCWGWENGQNLTGKEEYNCVGGMI
ncbi:MAG: hypothetical protein ACTTIO_05070 [Candidatus Fimenecus sp.]